MTFASIADIEALKEQVRSLNLLVLLLPEVNQRVLKVRLKEMGTGSSNGLLHFIGFSLSLSLSLLYT